MLPVQNLNGYDHPWAAGGGTNKYSGPTDVVVDNQLFANVQVDPIPAGTYTLSATLVTEPFGYGTCRVAFRKADGSGIEAVSLPYTANTRTSVSFTLTDVCERIYFYYSASTSGTGNQTYKQVQIEIGSTATSYAPYSNVCPIYGHTSATAHVSPNEDLSDPTEYTEQFGQTVYGGTLDFTTGVLTVTYGIVDLGTLTWVRNAAATTPVFYATITGIKPSAKLVSEIYNYLGAFGALTTFANFSQNGDIASGTEIERIYVRADSYADAASFKTAMSGVQLAYELATPQEIQLTPQEITTLYGKNNVWVTTTTNQQ